MGIGLVDVECKTHHTARIQSHNKVHLLPGVEELGGHSRARS